jgi:acetylornithine deacetylase/succinyl-diaminopimelate desuccinylase-like protein
MIIDRRLTLGENETKALAEVQRVIAREGVSADVEVTRYRTLSYTGYECDVREFFPAWVIAADHPLVSAAVRAAQTELERRPQVTRWGFSTEGVYTAGEAGIPTVGLGPGREERAHTADEHVQLRDVYAAAAIYAQLAMRLLG